MKQKRWKIQRVCLSMFLVLAMVVGGTPISAQAASRKKIKNVSLKITADIQPGTRYGEEQIEVETRGEKYSFDTYDIENFGFEWEEDDVPEITIYLQAREGYYFSMTKASDVMLSGAAYVKATKQNSSETLKLTVKLPTLAETVDEMTEVNLSDGGYAYWDPVRGAKSYEVRLYRNGEGVGITMLSTEELQYDFTSVMNRPGSYQCKVRGVNGLNSDNKSEWMESSAVVITEEQAKAIRNGTAAKMPVKGEWRLSGDRWWYEHGDGSYTTNNWEEIKGEWYFFDEEGYMKTGWIDWNGTWYYCHETSGAMMKNTTTPDGYILDNDGKLKNDAH